MAASILDKLNLRPQERRLVVIVGIVLFIVFNVWWVFPIFGELGRNQQRIRDAQAKIQSYQQEISQQTEYNRQINNLRAQGIYIASEDQVLQLAREIQTQAALSKINMQSVNPRNRGSGRTNAFFQEQAVVVSLGNTGEKELVDFLYSLSDRDSLTRVRDMSLRPDPTRVYLAGSITLVKSFQRNPPPAPSGSSPAPAPAATAAPGPAGNPGPSANPAEPAGSAVSNQPAETDTDDTEAPPTRALPSRVPPKPIP